MITFKLAISYMKKQKGKTIALLSSIALAVMLIFSMNVIRDSGYDSQIQEAKDLHGDYQVWFERLNIDKVKQLETGNEVKKASKVKYFCEIVNKENGVKLDLNSYDENFINSLNYKIVGREPRKDGEIVIEKEAAEQMGISNPLNKNIDMLLMNNYVDVNGINKIDSKNKTFKIVGLIEKPDRYYSSLSRSVSGVKTQAFVYKEAKLPIKTKDTYKGTIFLKSEKNTSNFLNRMEKKLNLSLNDGYFYENAEVSAANFFKDISKNNIENIKKIILLVIVSSLVIYNIFNIILKDMTIQIGLMRSIGMSRKKIKTMFVQLSLIYIVLGTVIGILFGMIVSYIGVRLVYDHSSRLTIQGLSIAYSFTVSVVSVAISSFIVVRKSIKMSIVDSIKDSEKYKKKSKKKNTTRRQKNIIRSIAIRNIWRNKTRTIITMLAITMVGAMFIFSFAVKDTLKTNIELGITGGIWGMSYGSVDKTISGSSDGSESLFYKIDKNIINKIKNIDGVKSVEANFFNPYGNVILSRDQISKSYKDELNRKNELYQEEHNNEYPLLIRGYSDEILRVRESFIEEGKNLINVKEGKYKKVILVNNTYSGVTNSFEAKVIDGAKVGDIINIKIPVYKDGTKQYETLKVEVSAIMNGNYAAAQDGNVGVEGAQVIFREDDYRELTNQKDYNKIYVMAEKGEVDLVEKRLEKLTKNYAFSSIGGKGEDMKLFGAQQSSEDRLTVIYQCLILLILSVNSIFIMRSNIIARKKEISTLRAIGMSLKDIKKTLIIESQFYGIVASTIGAIIATIYQYIGISNANKSLMEGSFERTIEFNVPWNQIIILFTIFIIIGFVSVYVSKDKIEGISITEGISEND